MSTAHVEAIAFAIYTALFLALSALAFRTQRRTGYRSQWRYIALVAAALGIIILIFNLNGYAFSGQGGVSHD